MAELFSQIQEKYTAEAQKRLRPDGVAQFLNLEESDDARLRRLADDPWADHAALDALEPPISPGSRHKFLVIGAGISGLLSAVRLIQAGFSADQIRLVDGAGGIGGTWYWNRYPGIHCDVEAYIYMPLLQETGYMPSTKYASGVEIRNYLNDVAKKYNLADKVLLRSTVEGVEWDEGSNVWKANISAGRGPRGADKSTFTAEAEFVVLTSGLLAKPHVPKLGGAGLSQFKGELLHTSRWDYNATGGSAEEVFPQLDKLKGKRVGIIGTGATAIQAVPILAQHAGELFVFQRTPSAVYQRGQRDTTPEEWAKVTQAGQDWQTRRMNNNIKNITWPDSGGEEDLINDEWSRQKAYAASVGGPGIPDTRPEKVPEIIGHFLGLDAENSMRLRARVAAIVEDKDTAEKLTPWYPIWCKRPTFSETYLPAFNQPNVHLVDTDGKGVDGATQAGLTVGGKEYPLDVLVLATGFLSPSTGNLDPAMRAGVRVTGKAGRTLSDKWSQQGPSTLHGCISSGFPNLFFINPAQAGVAPNQAHAIDVQARHIAQLIAAAAAAAATTSRVVVDVDTQAEEAWAMQCVAGAARFATFSVCTPGYINNEGARLDMSDQAALFKAAKASPIAEGLLKYEEILDGWRKDGKMQGLVVTPV